MYQLGKTIYVLSEKTYIHCDDKTLTIVKDDGLRQSIPYEQVSEIIFFFNTTLSSYVMYQCSLHSIIVCYVSVYGKYYGQFIGIYRSNVLLRKAQFDMIGTEKALNYVKNLIAGKIQNCVGLLRYLSKNNMNKTSIMNVVDGLVSDKRKLLSCASIDDVRFVEETAAARYFSIFDLLIKVSDVNMQFIKRSKRPPENNVNALLSFLYTMMTLICVSACACKGLDSECGYLHVLRSGRCSLACDLVEEFRSCVVDRFVLNLLNRQEIVSADFELTVEGIRLTDKARKKVLQKWENYLRNTYVHFSLYDKDVLLCLVPYEQAQLLGQYIRGDISDYPTFVMSF